ncbi:hypothetical protein [Clostridium drakei]|uniref:Uncharacterized protein n=1 Tax=Clostridium drakei TaxID=332101 RepID=A0A2U8DPW5_9CLOT|nr:hypothetical protein [Clostridium drakei]AWI04142.1 hypothetical protein B9W14_06410 [Clostridium drakei]
MADNLYYSEGSTSVKDIIKTLVNEITQKAIAAYKWTLVYPTDSSTITDHAIVSTHNLYCDRTFYTKFERSAATIPTSDQQKLINKYNNSKPLTDEQYKLMASYVESLDFGKINAFINGVTYYETTVFKKDSSSLNVDETTFIQLVRTIRNITDDYEVTLIYKYLNGIAMTQDEQNRYQTFKESHELTSNEAIDWTALKNNRKFYSDNIVIILLKEHLAPNLLSTSDQNSLASYRQSMELTNTEMLALSQLKAGMDNRNHIEITIGTAIQDVQVMENGQQITIKDLVEEECSLPARLAWYKNLDSNIGNWLPVQYWITQNVDSINLVLRGDPSADNYPYNNYLTSYAYIGALKPVADSAYTDDIYNFGVTTSSDIAPTLTRKYGPRTGTGVTDFCMVGNKVGMPYQPHYSGFYTSHAFMDKCNFEGSRWNLKKHQFSDVTLIHPIDMERGKLQNVLVGDVSSIYDTDRLSYKKDTDDEEMYRKFKISAPYWLLNNSANNLYCVAIRIPITTSE